MDIILSFLKSAYIRYLDFPLHSQIGVFACIALIVSMFVNFQGFNKIQRSINTSLFVYLIGDYVYSNFFMTINSNTSGHNLLLPSYLMDFNLHVNTLLETFLNLPAGAIATLFILILAIMFLSYKKIISKKVALYVLNAINGSSIAYMITLCALSMIKVFLLFSNITDNPILSDYLIYSLTLMVFSIFIVIVMQGIKMTSSVSKIILDDFDKFMSQEKKGT